METILGVQIIAILFAIFMLYVAFLHLKQKNINRKEYTLWMFIWLSFIFFTLFPQVLTPVLKELFIFRAMDLLMIIAFMILTYLGFKNHIGVKNLERQIEIIIRQKATKNAKKSSTD
jgi:hypothetical protein